MADKTSCAKSEEDTLCHGLGKKMNYFRDRYLDLLIDNFLFHERIFELEGLQIEV